MYVFNYCQSFLGIGNLAQTVFYNPTRPNPSDKILEGRVKGQQSDFLAAEKIRPELQIWEKYSIGFTDMRGVNISGLAEPIICFTPELQETDPNAFNWILKHQICHVKNNDILCQSLLHTGTAAVMQFALNYLETFTASINPLGPVLTEISKQIAIYGISERISNLYAYHSLCQADDYAISHSTIDENKGGRRELKALQYVAKSRFSEGYAGIEPNGDIPLPSQPVYSERIRKIERKLLQAGVILEELDDSTAEKDLMLKLIRLINRQNYYFRAQSLAQETVRYS